jgi:hypothetical protein
VLLSEITSSVPASHTALNTRLIKRLYRGYQLCRPSEYMGVTVIGKF